MKSNLRQTLEDTYGLQELHWILPHPFLPPRFKKICEQRNMILCLDAWLTIQVQWEGARKNEYLPLSPGQARKLFREVQRNMKKYASDAKIFSRFLEEFAETPFDHPRFDEVGPMKEANPSKLESEEPEKRIRKRLKAVRKPIHIPEKDLELDLGGESPMGEFFNV